MNPPSGALPESVDARAGEPAVTAATRPLYWSVRRELWESRSVYLAPPAVAAVFLVGFFIALLHLPGRMRAALALSPMQQQEAIEQPYVLAALMLMAIQMLVAVFYCLDAVYAERRDRSVLFWKSLPVSDLTVLLSKASIPILVLPLVTFGVTAATQLIMLLASSAVLAGSGLSAATLWTHVPFFKVARINLFHLVAIHGLWYAPFYGWLLMVSAWSKRAPLLWATLPPLAIGVVEKLVFNSSHFAAMLQYRAMGDAEAGAPAGRMTMDMLAPQSLGQFLTSPGLWIGLGVTAVFLFAAARLRRYRGPI